VASDFHDAITLKDYHLENNPLVNPATLDPANGMLVGTLLDTGLDCSGFPQNTPIAGTLIGSLGSSASTFTITYGGSNLSVWVNGVQTAAWRTVAESIGPSFHLSQVGLSLASTGLFRRLEDQSAGTWANHSGFVSSEEMDEIKICNHALSDNEIGASYVAASAGPWR
jgi:hypothetical protein